ncbi:hypothetical protein [Teichococcus rhizosphaerae]|uniref:hypothetical protein n=1 Tax=Teichococcus rhizosphaerae TaxID=1335062 RepID=UPI00114610DB|nr:hypothetical protein [Pseudoroseomonas rhizosphaerae]
MDQRSDRGRLQGRARARGHQAACGAVLAALLLGGCVGSPTEGPVEFWRNAFGAPLEGRPLPPGTEGAYPSIASVPPAPPRGAASEREALRDALADARSQSRTPVLPGRPVPPPPAGAESAGQVPLAPPRPPRLSAAPPVPRGSPDAAPGLAPAPAAPDLPADPGAPPAPPPAEFMAPSPPAPPAGGMAAPPPPRL